MQTVIIAGASGFIGQYLEKRFQSLGWTVVKIGRKEKLHWHNAEAIIAALNNCDVLINLAGTSVNCIHNKANRKAIMDSRVDTTALLNQYLLQCEKAPALWLNASGVAIYPRSVDDYYTENSKAVDTTFMAKVCEAWEAALYKNEMPHTRRIAMRTAIVLGKEGGSLAALKKLTKLGLGGKVGNGQQMMSWIHLEDYFQIVMFAIGNKTIEGALNMSSPCPVHNAYFMKALRKALSVSFGLPAPTLAVKIGAIIMGTEASLALDSYNVKSIKLEKAGFAFEYPILEQAFVNFWHNH